jgi:hypothetical protein
MGVEALGPVKVLCTIIGKCLGQEAGVGGLGIRGREGGREEGREGGREEGRKKEKALFGVGFHLVLMGGGQSLCFAHVKS